MMAIREQDKKIVTDKKIINPRHTHSSPSFCGFVVVVEPGESADEHLIGRTHLGGDGRIDSISHERKLLALILQV